MTSAAKGGFENADKGGGVKALPTSAKILEFWQKIQIKRAYHYA